jgi:hypothetical protein
LMRTRSNSTSDTGWEAVHPAWRPICAKAMAVGIARGGRDRAGGTAASHST